jgi:hypothetical protein
MFFYVLDLNPQPSGNEDCGTLKIDAWHSGISVWCERVSTRLRNKLNFPTPISWGRPIELQTHT